MPDTPTTTQFPSDPGTDEAGLREAGAKLLAEELGMFWDAMHENGFSKDFTHDDLRRAANALLVPSLAAIAALRLRVETVTREKAEALSYAQRARASVRDVADRAVYANSYGVPGSDFTGCMMCQGGGAPGVQFKHDAGCPIIACEQVADQWRDDWEALQAEIAAAEARATAAEARVRELEAGLSRIAALSDKPADFVWRDEWNEPVEYIKSSDDLECFGRDQGHHDASLIARQALAEGDRNAEQ